MKRQPSVPGPRGPRRFVIVQPRGNWHGRGMHYDADQQAIEQERQRWVYGQVSGVNAAIADLTVDPAREYARFRQEYEETGNPDALRRALEYVRCPE